MKIKILSSDPNRRVIAVKDLRAVTGLSLLDAKNVIDKGLQA